MTISVWILFHLMFVHWFADFVCQTDKQAKGKSVDSFLLTEHVGVYTGLMAVGACGLFHTGGQWLAWVAANGVLHWVTDYNTSRMSSYFFKRNDYHNGFVVIGFDQFIHLVCLVGTYSVLH